MYWTKLNYETGLYDTILFTEELEVPHGDGFEVDMNGIVYEDYLNDISKYRIENGKLVEGDIVSPSI